MHAVILTSPAATATGAAAAAAAAVRRVVNGLETMMDFRPALSATATAARIKRTPCAVRERRPVAQQPDRGAALWCTRRYIMYV